MRLLAWNAAGLPGGPEAPFSRVAKCFLYLHDVGPDQVAVGKSFAILLHPPLPSVDVSVEMQKECQQIMTVSPTANNKGPTAIVRGSR